MMDDPSKYQFETLRDDGEFILSRVVSRADSPPTLVLAPASDQPDLASLKRLDQECEPEIATPLANLITSIVNPDLPTLYY